jgi:4-hydroxy-tetrahydrodipicolinate reductase
MIKIVVCGVAGRMGQRLAHLTLAAEDLELCGGKEHPAHEAVGRDIGELIGSRRLDLEVRDTLSGILEPDRVVFNFTTPEATLEDATLCAERGAPMVVGTTGFTPEQLEEFKRIVSNITCVFAANFSTAMNVLFKLVEEAARILGDDYDVEVIETHHRHKVDAPSGSALTLAERAAAGLGRNLREVVVHGREGIVGERTRQEIGMHAIRAGDLAGEHRVLYAAPGEYIELKHHATSRDSFALGALRAARFAAGAEPGLYSMGDVLGLG